MSTIRIKKHDEVINMILYEAPPPRPKSMMYISDRLKGLRKLKNKPTHITMGLAEEPLNPPECFLRKAGGVEVPRKQPLADNEYYKKDSNKPKIIHKKHKCDKRKLSENKELQCVDSPRGHKTNILKNMWVNSKNFGFVPCYLVNQNIEIQEAQDEYRKKLENQTPLCRRISDEEKEELLNGLKHNRTELQKDYLLLPILIDTIPKVLRKSHLEKSLDKIEKDVRLIEANPYIYVYD